MEDYLDLNIYMEELLELTKENNRMLKQILAYIYKIESHSSTENENDFIRNIFANLISTSMIGR